MTTIMTKRAGFAIAAGTLASILLAGAAAAAAGNVHGGAAPKITAAGNVHGATAPKYTITRAEPTSIKGGLINRGNLGQSILGQIGTPTGGGKPGSGGSNKGSGGTVVSCQSGSGCTTKPSSGHDHDGYGRHQPKDRSLHHSPPRAFSRQVIAHCRDVEILGHPHNGKAHLPRRPLTR